MEPKKLFIRSLDDLHLSINSGDEYEVLRASGIIRQLFLDGSSLVDQVNRIYKLKLRYRVIKPTFPNIDGLPEPEIWCEVDSIDPRRSPKMEAITDLNKASFLGLRIGRAQGQDYSVKDIISFVANTAGGIHSGVPKNKKDQVLDKLRELRIFSELSILLQHLRSIGRIILEGLRPLRNKALNLERFQDAPGYSFHMALTLLPVGKGQELFILDVGVDKQKNRCSIYLDGRQELCFRLIDSSGQAQTVRAGSHDCAFFYGRPGYLTFQVAFYEKEVLLQLDTGGWSMVKTFPREQISLNPDKLFYVLGSDVIGEAKTHMHVMEKCIYSRHLKEQEAEKLRDYFEDKIQQGYKASVYFKGNKFMYSKNHPNFIDGRGCGSSVDTESGPAL